MKSIPGATPVRLKFQKSANRWELLGVGLLYTLLTLGMTYPLVGQLATAAAGFAGRDSWQHVWYQWWLKETLLELGIWPDSVTYLYYPLGAEHPVLALHPYVPLVSLPLTLLFGPLVSYNLVFWLSFILSGLSGYLLCRYLCRQPAAAWVGGLIFAFYPNRLGHAVAGHLLLTSNYFLPLYALSLLILLDRPSLKTALWHGLITALLALAQPTHIGYGIIPVFLFLVGGQVIETALQPSANVQKEQHDPVIRHSFMRSFAWLAAAGLLALVLFLPFAWPIFSQSQQGDLAYLTPENVTEHSTDLLAFLMPSPYNPILAQTGLVPAFSQSIIGGLRDLEEQLAYPGLVVLGLAGLAIWQHWRVARVWLGLTLGCGLLSLGPLLKIGGQVTTILLPYAWLIDLPFFTWSRTPGRLNETVMLGLAVLAALGAAWLLGQIGRWRTWVVAGVSLLIVIEFVVILPFPVEARLISTYYPELAQEPLSGGVLELPVIGSRRASNYAMYYQTVHQHPLAGGYIERDPPGTVELKEFLNQLVSPLPPQTVFTAPVEADRLAILADMHIARVIAHPALLTDRAARATRAYLPLLLGAAVFADADTLVYAVPPEAVNTRPDWQILPDQENWEVGRDGAVLRLKETGYLFIYAAEAGSLQLNFQIDPPPQPLQLSLQLNHKVAESFSLAEAAYTTGPLSLRRGLNYLRLSTEPAAKLDFLHLNVQRVSN